jgi:hypothetical protein
MDSALSLRRTRGDGISSAVFNECIADEFLCVGLWEVMQPLDKCLGDFATTENTRLAMTRAHLPRLTLMSLLCRRRGGPLLPTPSQFG